jgi:hypothetical protein
MKQEEAQKVSVSLYDDDREIVERVSQEKGLNNFSAALRMIIREWDKKIVIEVSASQVGDGVVGELKKVLRPESA